MQIKTTVFCRQDEASFVEAFKPMETINESSETTEGLSTNNDHELSVNVSLLVQEQMAKTPTIIVTEDATGKAKGKQIVSLQNDTN